MTDNDQLLDNIGNLIDRKLEPIKKDMATKADVQRVEQGQAQIHTTLGQITTAVNALAAGQKDIHDNMATKADIHRLEQKIDKVDKHVKSHESRIENLEEHTGIPNPHKN
jgi:hypothetical protein